MHLARPLRDAIEAQPNRRVLVVVIAGKPGMRARHLDAELFVKLARKRVGSAFTRLDLAAGEFPVAFVDFPDGPLSEQKAAVGTLEDRSDDFDSGSHI